MDIQIHFNGKGLTVQEAFEIALIELIDQEQEKKVLSSNSNKERKEEEW